MTFFQPFYDDLDLRTNAQIGLGATGSLSGMFETVPKGDVLGIGQISADGGDYVVLKIDASYGFSALGEMLQEPEMAISVYADIGERWQGFVDYAPDGSDIGMRFALDPSETIGFAIIDESNGERYVARRLVMTDSQWDLVSGEAYFLGYKTGGTYHYERVNDSSKALWSNFGGALAKSATIRTESTDSRNALSSTEENAVFPSVYQVDGQGSDRLEALTTTELAAVQALRQNLSLRILGDDYKADSGYAFDEGYFQNIRNGANGYFHAGIDLGTAGTTPDVRSPVNGHIVDIRRVDDASDYNQYLVIRELDGDRVWLLGHIDPAADLEIGQYVCAASTVIGEVHDDEPGHFAHLHVQTSTIQEHDESSFRLNELTADPGGFNAAELQNIRDHGLLPKRDVIFDTSDGFYTYATKSAWEGWRVRAFGAVLDMSGATSTTYLQSVLDHTDSPLQALYEEDPVMAIAATDRVATENLTAAFGGASSPPVGAPPQRKTPTFCAASPTGSK